MNGLLQSGSPEEVLDDVSGIFSYTMSGSKYVKVDIKLTIHTRPVLATDEALTRTLISSVSFRNVK